MRRLIIIFLTTILTLFTLEAEKYTIISLSTPTITIGGKPLKKGDTFSDTSTIKWVDNHQSMEVKATSTGEVYRFSKKVLLSKGATTSIADYFLKTKKASSRGDNNMPIFTKSAYSGNFPERRIALVIGNSNYYNLSYLRNASKDASDIAETLLTLGFDVMETYETSFTDMKTAINNFSAKAANYDVAMFYFAGHGLQEDGVNYLIPVENPLEFKNHSLNTSIDCDDIVERMNSAGTPSKIIFLDACRNTKKSWSRASDKGLARMEASVGSVIVFATQSGNVAMDGEGDNSPFAISLMKNIKKPNITYSVAMDDLVRDTYNLTQKKQYPQKTGTLINDFQFNTTKTTKTQNNSNRVNNNGTSSTSISYNPESAEELYRKANNYFDNKNYTEALKCYHGAADQGSAAALNEIGYMYSNGLGVTKDHKKAVPYFLQAALKGNATGQYNIAYCYEFGSDAKQDYNEAAQWYNEAAKQNHVLSQYRLGTLYYYGRGVDKNYNEAAYWFLKAAEAGNMDSQNFIGICYNNGYGVEKNYATAMRWYKLAAEQGDAHAYYNIGLLYENGNGVAKNINEAKRWYKMASDKGNKEAKTRLDKLSTPTTQTNPTNTTQGGKPLTIMGWVKDSGNEPLIGCTVMVKGTTDATVTDLDGTFRITNVAIGSTLVFSYVGYKPKEVKIKSINDIPLTVKLSEH